MTEEAREDLANVSIENMNGGEVIDCANEALAVVLRHCKEFPDLRKPRKIKIEIQLMPSYVPGTNQPYVTTKCYAQPVTPPIFGSEGAAVLINDEFKVAVDTQADLEEHIDELERHRATKAAD